MSLLLLRYLSATAIAAATTTHSSLVVIFRFYNRIFAAAATVQCKVWEGHNTTIVGSEAQFTYGHLRQRRIQRRARALVRICMDRQKA